MKALVFQISACATIAAAALATALVTITDPLDTSAIPPTTAEILLPKLEPIAIDLGPPAQRLAIIADRPLFWRSRRPFKPAPPAPSPQLPTVPKGGLAPPEPPQSQNLVLKGVFLNGKDARALIASDTDLGVWIKQGEKIKGWQLRNVEPDAVELEHMGRKAALRLYTHDANYGLYTRPQPYIEGENARAQ